MSTEELPQSIDRTVTAPMADQVECRDFGRSGSFSSCDEACGSFPKWEVGVLLNELCHALGVSGVEIDRDQFSRCE